MKRTSSERKVTPLGSSDPPRVAVQPAGSHRSSPRGWRTEGRAAQHSGARLLPVGRHMLELAQHESQRGPQAHLGAPDHNPWKGWQNRWCSGTRWRRWLCRRNLGERSVGTGGRGRVMDEDGITASAQGTSTGSGPCRLLREHRVARSARPSGQAGRTRGGRLGGWVGPGRVSGPQHAGARLKVVEEVARRFAPQTLRHVWQEEPSKGNQKPKGASGMGSAATSLLCNGLDGGSKP
jgi:hypothetical protein